MYIYIAPTHYNPSRRRVCSTSSCQCTYARLNKKVFSFNSVRDNSLWRISFGSLFQSFGPANAKLLVPDVDLVDCSWPQVTTTRVCRNRLKVSCQIWGSCVLKAYVGLETDLQLNTLSYRKPVKFITNDIRYVMKFGTTADKPCGWIENRL